MKRTKLRRRKKDRSPKDKAFDKSWKRFRDYIIKRDKGICITCGKRGDQGGHLIHGKWKPDYFNPINVNCQCRRCNYFMDGNRDVYLRALQQKYGIKKTDALLKRRDLIKKWSLKELENIILKYKP